MLDVTIPVKGDPETVMIAPSSQALISANYQIRGSAIVLCVPDNDRADGEIDVFIQQVNGNLENLRQEVARYDGQVMGAVQQEAQRRKAEIEDDNRREVSGDTPLLIRQVSIDGARPRKAGRCCFWRRIPPYSGISLRAGSRFNHRFRKGSDGPVVSSGSPGNEAIRKEWELDYLFKMRQRAEWEEHQSQAQTPSD